MLSLIIDGDGPIARALTERLQASGHEVHARRLSGNGDSIKDHLDDIAVSARYGNIFIDLTDGFDEIAAFNMDPDAARLDVERRLKDMLCVLKYGANHMARGDGGRIWVLCYDHSVSFSVDTPSNPITNHAATAAVQCIAKEVAHFDVKVNLFMIQPPGECVDPMAWRKAKNNLHVYRLKYKPQTSEHVSEMLHMYAEIKHLTTTGGVIPVGSGIAVCNV